MTPDPSSSAAVASGPGIPGLQTLAEWNKARLDTVNQTCHKQKTTSASPAWAPGPSKPKGNFAARLNDLVQVHHLRAEYCYEEGPPQTFVATLVLTDSIRNVGSFQSSTASSSKKAAKESVARQATQWLEQRGAPKNTARAAEVLGATVVDKSQDWTSLLNEFCQKSHVTFPEYAIHVVGPQRFSATCSISGQVYGDETVGYASKKDAKAAAAQIAVSKLREDGVMGRRPEHVSLFSSSSAASLSSSTPSANPASATPSSVDSNPTASASSLVPALCQALSERIPAYRFTSDPPGTAFVSGAAHFEGSLEPALHGPVGAVERVYGKKNAKDQCAKLVLGVLEGIKQERLRGTE